VTCRGPGHAAGAELDSHASEQYASSGALSGTCTHACATGRDGYPDKNVRPLPLGRASF
jgi:hypothetical protein